MHADKNRESASAEENVDPRSDTGKTVLHTIVVHLLSHVLLFATPWTATCQASLSFAVSWSLLRFMSVESAMLF